MAESGYTKVDVFFSAPGDTEKERAHAELAIDELNETVGRSRRIALRLLHWESHTVPDMGRPQSVINDQIANYDIYVGVMWRRFGSPTGKAGSGTEEEFTAAYKSWEATDRPRIMFYFNQTPFMPRTLEENDEMRKVLDFRNKVSWVGLTRSYTTMHEFSRYFREHIAKLLLFDSRFSPTTGEADAAVAPTDPATLGREGIPRISYGPMDDPTISLPIVRFHVTNLDSHRPVRVKTVVDILVDGQPYGRPVRHYSGERLWNCNPGTTAAGWFRLTDTEQVKVVDSAKDIDIQVATEIKLRVTATVVEVDGVEHELLPVEWYYSRDRGLWVYDP